MYFPTVNLSQRTARLILSISEDHGAIMLKPFFLNVHWEIIFMNAVFMTGRKRMHEIRFCTQNIEITPHPSADTTSNNRSLNDDIHCIDGRCIPYPHRAEYVCELDAVQAEHFSKENVLSGADYWNP